MPLSVIESEPNNEIIDLIGRGLYTLPEAAKILQMTRDTLSRWAQGYTFSTRSGERHASSPVIGRELMGHTERILTFQDLIELKFVSLLRASGVSMRTIKAVAEIAKERYNSSYPFATHRFFTDGKRLFLAEEPPRIPGLTAERVLTELIIGQTVMDSVANRFFVKIDYDDEAKRLWPLGHERQVVLDPARSFGAPIDPLSGVPTRTLFKMLTGGESIDRIAWWYSVSEDSVKDAIEFETTLMAA